jgi:uncharacterized protein (TIGR04255 family)
VQLDININNEADMSDICYKKNFLKQVIAKIDFAQPLSDLTPESLLAAVDAIKKRFPISEQATGVHQGIQITHEQVQTSKSEFPEWNFHGLERDKSIKINQFFLQVLLTKYKTEEDFKADLIVPISQVISSHPSTLIARTGVRFINIFDFPIIDFNQVGEYFAESISGHLSAFLNPEFCTRSFLINEFLIDNIKLRMQSGFFNPDYPAVIKRHHFVIDIDACIDSPHQIKDVEGYLNEFHRKIQELFESHIKKKLRDEVLNG